MDKTKNKKACCCRNKDYVKETVTDHLSNPSTIDHNVKKQALGPNTRQ